MMIKFLLGIAMVAFTSFCGYLLSKKYRQRKLFFLQLKEFNGRFLNEISYYRRPIAEFASGYSYQGEFQTLLSLFFEKIKERSATEKIFLEDEEFTFLSRDEKRLIEDYFQMLGKGDSTSQKGYFSSAKDVLSKLQTETEADCKKYGDLYVKLGFLCGLLILIIML